MADQPTALRLAAQLEDTESARLHLLPYAAAELRRQHNLLDIANTVCRTSAKEIERLKAENESLKQALAASCDEERSQLWEASPGGGCSRALSAEAVNRELLEALKHAHTWLQGSEPGRAQYLGEIIAKAEKT
jgi:cell division septum initiation protein DivIVA